MLNNRIATVICTHAVSMKPSNIIPKQKIWELLQVNYSFYQLALVAGLQKDYDGKVALLNRMANKYPSSPYTINALYEKGRSYVQTSNSRQAIAAFKELL